MKRAEDALAVVVGVLFLGLFGWAAIARFGWLGVASALAATFALIGALAFAGALVTERRRR